MDDPEPVTLQAQRQVSGLDIILEEVKLPARVRHTFVLPIERFLGSISERLEIVKTDGDDYTVSAMWYSENTTHLSSTS